ncbi:hypothetical protein [Pseudoalteromonas sp. BDTF-M6]|uniref:hypothetical protein n=1 Tax=Pseudoalteromonas sp. BDTF-M6 TaxID=2796132 RepID=UPI001BAFFCD3|nr:hypothetical protein [Pseudoalteromonas sp. BDTF-M6]MBS3797898.1 hypothetical protein [Pseudoalteromonas sp. BDTF-M6]
MKYLLTAILLLCTHIASATGKLASELQVFEPYLGTWESTFSMGPEQPDVTDVGKWERALNGTAIRTMHSINDGAYGGESLIFWDKGKESLVFYYFTTAGFYTQGTLEVTDDGSFVAYEDVSGSSEGITRVKSTSSYVDGQFVVTTQYLKNGEWTPEQKRHYSRSQKEVVFK